MLLGERLTTPEERLLLSSVKLDELVAVLIEWMTLCYCGQYDWRYG